MKVNRALPWQKRLKNLRVAVALSAFLPVGGRRRFARRQAGYFEIRKITVPFAQLPPQWDGLTLTQLSDLHIGPGFTVRDHLPPVIEACRELNSDLLVVTGDWVDRHSRHLAEALPLLGELKAPLGVYGCLGNHDVFDTRRECLRGLRRLLGSRLLVNEAATFERDGSRLALMGIDYGHSAATAERHLRTVASRLPAADFRIMLSHDPARYPVLRQLGCDLVLSGHTHGGQISLTPEPHRVVGPMMFKFHYMRGLYREENSALYVNRGLGQTVPFRLNNPPEITQLRLVREKDKRLLDGINEI